jgi:aspartate racemase
MHSVKRLGILGGMSWVSSLKYYETINLEILKLTEGSRTADLVLWSFDTTRIEPLIAAEDWRGIARHLQDAIDRMMMCKVEGIIIASNTIHRVLEQNHLKLPVPFVDIRDSLLNELHRQSITRVGFVGTSATMNGDIYRHLFDGSVGVDVVLPPQNLWADIDDMIFNGLCRGLRRDSDQKLARRGMRWFKEQGVEHVVLGCTELSRLRIETSGITLLDTSEIHARDAAHWSAGSTEVKIRGAAERRGREPPAASLQLS